MKRLTSAQRQDVRAWISRVSPVSLVDAVQILITQLDLDGTQAVVEIGAMLSAGELESSVSSNEVLISTASKPADPLRHVLEPDGEATNITSIRRWLTVRRPDVLEEFESILRRERSGESKGRALLFLMVIGWAAGRQHQQENPGDDSP